MYASTYVLLPLLLSAKSLAQSTVVITVAPPRPSDSPEFTDHAVFTSAILNSTNHYRHEHNATDVQWNKTLEDFAKSYLDSTCNFEHSGGPYGENLAIGCSNATSCVEMWGNERDKYDFNKGDFSAETGHFTQLVWKNTTDVGCGVKNCTGSNFLVCEYWPRGNVIGSFKASVAPKNGSAVASSRPNLFTTVLGVIALLAALYS